MEFCTSAQHVLPSTGIKLIPTVADEETLNVGRRGVRHEPTKECDEMVVAVEKRDVKPMPDVATKAWGVTFIESGWIRVLLDLSPG